MNRPCADFQDVPTRLPTLPNSRPGELLLHHWISDGPSEASKVCPAGTYDPLVSFFFFA